MLDAYLWLELHKCLEDTAFTDRCCKDQLSLFPLFSPFSYGPALSSIQISSQTASLCSLCSQPLPPEMLPIAPWDTPQGLGLNSIQLPFSPAIIQPEVEQLLGPCHPHILSVTLLRDIMYRGAPTTPPPSYLHSQLWTQALRGLHLRLHLLTTSAREEFQLLSHCYREHKLPTPSSHQARS